MLMEKPSIPDRPDAFDGQAADSNPLELHLVIIDPDVAAALREYSVGGRRNEFAESALKVGVLALRFTRGLFDGDTVRREGDRLIELLSERLNTYRCDLERNVAATLTGYFDPKNGRFTERVDRLINADGDLAKVMQSHVQNAQASISATLTQHLGQDSKLLQLLTPSESNLLLSAFRSTIDETLRAERQVIVREFSLDQPDSALSRLIREIEAKHGNLSKALSHKVDDVVAEFSLDKKDSALSRLVGRVEEAHRSIGAQFSLDNQESALSRLRREMQEQLSAQAKASAEFQQKVLGILDRLDARRGEAARSTRHGADFEADVQHFIEQLCSKTGDLFGAVGTTTGQIAQCKIGDFVITLGPDCAAAGSRIVVEAKENSSYNVAKTCEEADKARRNRSAGVSLFVHSKTTAPAGFPPFERYGDDVIVVWDANDEATDVFLQAGFTCARAISIKQRRNQQQEGADLDALERAIEAIRKNLEGLSEVRTSANTIKNAAQKIDQRSERVQERITESLQELSEHLSALREG